jgi:hypothetical protein
LEDADPHSTAVEACSDIGDVALKAKLDPTPVADRAFEALTVNDHGQFDELIRVLAPAVTRFQINRDRDRLS